MSSGRGQSSVLLVEGSESTRDALATVLRRAGHVVAGASDGGEALARFSEDRPDLVMLELAIAGVSGWEVLKRLRERSHVPILVLTTLADEGSKVRALNGGADDYIVKPPSGPELVARVGALLRRAGYAYDVADVYDDGAVRVDFDSRTVKVHGGEVALTPLEYRLLTAFVRRPGHVFSREELLREVWHDTTGGPSDHVKIYVGYLRRKLSAVSEGGELIQTVRGFGYRWPGGPSGWAGASGFQAP